MKFLLKMLFYEIPKDVWQGGAWDKEDHMETYVINLYLHHEHITYYSRIGHVTAIITLNILSLFSWEICISRVLFLMGYLKEALKR